MHKTMTTSCWCLIISYSKTWSELEFEYGTMNVYIFNQPAIHKGVLDSFCTLCFPQNFL